MFILDEETGNSFTITKDALNAITDHRLRMPKPKDVQAYTVDKEGHKIPNISLTQSLQHVQRECFFQLLEQLRQHIIATFQKHQDNTQNINTFKCGEIKIQRSVHIGFWKLLAEMIPKNPNFTIEDLSRMDLKDSDQFEITVLEATIKPRVQPHGNQPNRAG